MWHVGPATAAAAFDVAGATWTLRLAPRQRDTSHTTVQCGLPQLDRPYDWVVGATLLELHRTGEGRIVSIAGGPRGLTLKAIDDANMRLPQALAT